MGPFLLPAVAPPTSSAIWTLASLFLPGFPSFVSRINSSVYLGILCVGLLRGGAPRDGKCRTMWLCCPRTSLVRCSAGGWELQREAPGGSSGREGVNKGICAQREGQLGKQQPWQQRTPAGLGAWQPTPGQTVQLGVTPCCFPFEPPWASSGSNAPQPR